MKSLVTYFVAYVPTGMTFYRRVWLIVLHVDPM